MQRYHSAATLMRICPSRPNVVFVLFIYLNFFYSELTCIILRTSSLERILHIMHASIFLNCFVILVARAFLGGGNRCATGYYYIFYRVCHLFVYSLG